MLTVLAANLSVSIPSTGSVFKATDGAARAKDGTIVSAAEILLKRGATEVWAMATHGVLSGPAVDRLKNSPIARIVLTNTLPLPSEKQIPQIEVLSVAGIIAEALSAVFDDTSVSEIFDGENLA